MEWSMWAQDWGEKWHILVSLVNAGEEMPGGQGVHLGRSILPEKGLRSHGHLMSDAQAKVCSS